MTSLLIPECLRLGENDIYVISHPESTSGNILYWNGKPDWTRDIKSAFRVKDLSQLVRAWSEVRRDHPMVPAIVSLRTEKIIDQDGNPKWQVISDLRSIDIPPDFLTGTQ